MCDRNIAELTVDTVMTIVFGPGLALYMVPESWLQAVKGFLNSRANHADNQCDTNDKKSGEREYQLNKSALNETLSFVDGGSDDVSRQIKSDYSLEEILGLKEEKRTCDHSGDRSSRESSVSSLLNFVPTYFNGSSGNRLLANLTDSSAPSGVGEMENEEDEFEIIDESDFLEERKLFKLEDEEEKSEYVESSL